MDAERVALLRRVGSILRGDWTMTRYDGRDVRNWIETALDGNAGQLADLARTLDDLENE